MDIKFFSIWHTPQPPKSNHFYCIISIMSVKITPDSGGSLVWFFFAKLMYHARKKTSFRGGFRAEPNGALILGSLSCTVQSENHQSWVIQCLSLRKLTTLQNTFSLSINKTVRIEPESNLEGLKVCDVVPIIQLLYPELWEVLCSIFTRL